MIRTSVEVVDILKRSDAGAVRFSWVDRNAVDALARALRGPDNVAEAVDRLGAARGDRSAGNAEGPEIGIEAAVLLHDDDVLNRIGRDARRSVRVRRKRPPRKHRH
jgi:hypothetical protein